MNTHPPGPATWLCARQYELADRLERLDRDMPRANDPLVPDFPHQAVLQRQNDEVIDRLRALTEVELDRIDTALARLAAGSYGECECCGESIESLRLDVLPETELCSSCASAAPS